MKSLKDVLKVGLEFGFSDKDIIKEYIISNDLESEYVAMISELSQSKIDKLDAEIRQHQWLAYPADNLYQECYKKKIKPDIARLLDMAQRQYILGFSIEPIANDLKEHTEEITIPNPFYQPALQKLIELGVKFKDMDGKIIGGKIND